MPKRDKTVPASSAKNRRRIKPSNPAFQLSVNGRIIRSADATQAAILDAATEEFAASGFSGARVDSIAVRAKTNKRMLYHFFSDKAGLYLAVLEKMFAEVFEAEKGLHIKSKEPEDGIRQLTLFIWTYVLEHPHFVRLVSTENQLKAQYLKKSESIPLIHSHFVEELSDVLRRGIEKGVFRQNINPSMVHLTILSMSFYYISNKYTVAVSFGHDTSSEEATTTWGEHIVETVLASLK
jgi:AcrR family transcriptional regulator